MNRFSESFQFIAWTSLMVLTGFFATVAEAQVLQYSVVAKSNEPAPGAGGANFSSFFGPPRINEEGKVVFNAEVVSAIEGIWSGFPGSLGLVAIENSDVPGLAGVQFDEFAEDINGLIIASDGGLAFRANLKGSGISGANRTSLFVGYPGALHLVQRRGTTAPGTSSLIFDEPANIGGSFHPHLLREGLRYAFHAQLDGTPSNTDDLQGIWGGIAPAVNLIARSTQTTNQGTLRSVFDSSFGMDSNGVVQFSGAVNPLVRGIFSADGSSITRLFGQGDEVGNSGETFDQDLNGGSFDHLNYHADKGLSFTGLLDTSEGAPLPGFVIFLGGNLIHRNGTFALNDSNAPAVLTGGGDRIVNAQGRILERGTAFGVPALFLSSATLPASFTTVAKNGMQAPGLPLGIVFGSNYFNYGMNDTGITVFTAVISGPGVTSDNDDVLYLYDPNKGIYQLLGRNGTEMVIDDGESFTPRFSPGFTDTNGNASGQSAGINNRNEIVFLWRGTDFGDRLVLVKYDPDGVVVSRRPDVSVGGVGTGRFAPVVQDRSAKLRRSSSKGVKFPVIVAQSGNAGSVMRIGLSGNFKAAKVKTFLMQGGRNVTAAAAAGTLLTPVLGSGERWTAELKVVADRKKTRVGHNYLARIAATASDGSTDTAGIRLKVVE